MKNILSILAFMLLVNCSHAQSFITRFEQSNQTQSPTYPEIINWWKKLDASSDIVKMLTMGPSDAGFPLHLVLVSTSKDFNMESIHKKDKRIILINNGIHPGEPDGIDASMLLVRDIVLNKKHLPDNIVLAIIPVYNIGGCLNRSSNYRIDQNGPEEKGFRGNSENLDLNRDFIKSDSKEARAFAEIFHLCDPDVLVDNHVSDGADYQHVMTLLTSQHDKLGGPLGEFMNSEFEPGLYALMKEKGYDLVPYVNNFSDTPESGWSEFWDSPRYSSGYASLWQSFAFVPETHMLKPFAQRVKATYALMESVIQFTNAHSSNIKMLRDQAKQSIAHQTRFPIGWILDKSRFKEITFKGFEAGRKPSAVSGLPRLYYDRSKPFEKQVKFYNHYEPKSVIEKPRAYIIPQGWWRVIDLLKLNKVNILPLNQDTTMVVEVYHIDEYKSSGRPYEMHHLNSEVKITPRMQTIRFRKGDYLIPMNQPGNRFITEVLEPQAEDSYFTWNFFDSVLGQKEGFSNYVFEDQAAVYLAAHPELQAKMEQQRKSDSNFARNAGAQLDFVFRNSPYYEPDHLRYPVYRLMN